MQAGTAVIVTGTSAFTAVQWAIGALLYERNVLGVPTATIAVDPAGCLKNLKKDNMFYYRRQMRCAFSCRCSLVFASSRTGHGAPNLK